MLNKIIYSFICVLIFQLGALAQSKFIKKATEAEQSNNFTEAVKYYQKAFEEESDPQLKREIAFNTALNHIKMNNYKASFTWFEDAIGAESDNASYYIAYGDALAKSGDFKKAKSIFEKALKINPISTKIKSKLKSLTAAISAKREKSAHKIRKEILINSEYSEFGPGWFNDNLVFASTRLENTNENIDGRTGQGYSDLYISVFDENNNKWLPPEILKSPLGSKYNDGTFSYDKNTSTAYTMQCNKNSNNCIIVSAKYDAFSDTWGKSEKINFDVEEFSVGHPSISMDGKVLYFVSDMTGGFGGKDIWKVLKKDNGSWGLPINLGDKINSPQNEMFPFILRDSILFFASDGHFGLGGLDIFYSRIENYEFTPSVNIGFPFNSSADDFGMIIRENLNGGLFCTNRKTASSDDIYSFDYFPLSLKIAGLLTDKNTKTSISNGSIIISGPTDNDTISTSEKGYYEYFGLMPKQTYEIKATKEGYYPEIRLIELNSELLGQFQHEIKQDFRLTKKQYVVAIKGSVLDRANLKPMPGELVEITGPNNYHSLSYTNSEGIYLFDELKPQNIYTIKVSKDGYFSESRSCNLPKVKKPTTFSKSSGYDMDFLLTKIEKKKEITLNNIYYDFDKSTLRPESKTELNKLASMLRETPGVVIQINSHSDAQGAEWYNLKLSKERAQSVVNYMISNGVNEDMLMSKGFGESQLLINNAKTEAEHQKNRRTTFNVLEYNESTKTAEEETNINSGQNKLTFRVQLMSTKHAIPGKQLFKNLLDVLPNTNIFVQRDNGVFKYEIGSRENLKEASALKKQVSKLGYKDCFINAYYEGKKISIQKAKQYLKDK
jgi:outer membrane protein OmpA-like peptidoglycan-associated protein/tetratricopeptide (TPR) repeat protein